MTNFKKWLAKNGFTYEINKLVNGGDCVFVKIFDESRLTKSILYKHLKKVKLNYQYVASYSWIRVDFKELV